MANLKRIKIELVGQAPLLMHNSQLANPNCSWTQLMAEITQKPKKKKTEDDLLMLQELEFMGGLYLDTETGPYVPPEWIEGALREGAKSVKGGLWKTVVAATTIDEDMIKLEYNGPREAKALYADKRFVDQRIAKVNGKSSILRTRPRFNAPWFLNFRLNYIPDMISFKEIETCLDKATIRGIGDYRPKFGRFVVKTFKEA